MLNRRLQRLVRVYTCQNTTLLEITSRLICVMLVFNLDDQFSTGTGLFTELEEILTSQLYEPRHVISNNVEF